MSCKRYILIGLKATVSLGLLGWLLGQVDWPALGRQLDHVRWKWLLLALSLPALSLPLLAMRWRSILGRLQLSMSRRQALGVTLTAQFFNSVLPGATGGDIYKIYSACNAFAGQKARAASSVVLDRLLALIALMIIGGISFISLHDLWRSLLAGQSLQLPSIVIAGGALLLLAGGLLWLARRREITHQLAQAWRALISSLRQSRCHAPTVLFPLLGLSLAIHLINFSGVYSIARALSIEVTYLQILALMPILLLITMLPLSINGHGLREFVIIGYFTLIQAHSPIGGSARELSIALSLVYVMTDLCWCLPGAVRYLLVRPVRPSQSVVPFTE